MRAIEQKPVTGFRKIGNAFFVDQPAECVIQWTCCVLVCWCLTDKPRAQVLVDLGFVVSRDDSLADDTSDWLPCCECLNWPQCGHAPISGTGIEAWEQERLLVVGLEDHGNVIHFTAQFEFVPLEDMQE